MTIEQTGHRAGRNAQPISRRALLRRAASIAAFPHIIPSSAFAGTERPAPSDRLTMGLVGLGSMGMRHVKGFLQEADCQIVAVCDVDAARRRAAVQEVNAHYGNANCAQYRDFRELPGQADIDVLCIAVPDHWHAIIALEGIKADKD
ncbi:MAG: Gfo/Idh/MocA family protein, partial [Planctomycetota bacterium]